MTFCETQDLHPRIAHWLDTQGLLYIHEHKINGGQIDFISIHPSSGHLSIIEAKMSVTRGHISQINMYERRLGITGVSKMLFSFHPVREDDLKYLEDNDIEVFQLGEASETAVIRRLKDTAYDFTEIFEAFHHNPLPGKGLTVEFFARQFYQLKGDAE